MPYSKSMWAIGTVITALICLGAGGPALAAHEGPYPIRWSPVLELDSLDDVERRLGRTLWKDSDDYLAMYKGEGEATIMTTANDCRSLKALSEDGYWGWGSNNIGLQHSLLARCRAVELLGGARPAKRSFLREFSLDSRALDYLPAPINGPSCDFACRQTYANEKGVPWSGFERIDWVEPIEDGRIEVRVSTSATRLRIVGRADVDGDDLEDVIIMVRMRATEGTYRSNRLFVLTRESPSAVLRILEPERYRCGDYECRRAYVLPVGAE